RFPVLTARNAALDSPSSAPSGNGPATREGSPSRGSIFTTSAPKSARTLPQNGPAVPVASSTTRTPASCPSSIEASRADLLRVLSEEWRWMAYVRRRALEPRHRARADVPAHSRMLDLDPEPALGEVRVVGEIGDRRHLSGRNACGLELLGERFRVMLA